MGELVLQVHPRQLSVCRNFIDLTRFDKECIQAKAKGLSTEQHSIVRGQARSEEQGGALTDRGGNRNFGQQKTVSQLIDLPADGKIHGRI